VAIQPTISPPATAFTPSPEPPPGQGARGYIGANAKGVIFIQWLDHDNQMTGEMYQTTAQTQPPFTKAAATGFTGFQQGQSVSLTFSVLGPPPTNWVGTLQDDDLTLTYPDSEGRPNTIAFHQGTLAEYNQVVQSIYLAISSDRPRLGEPLTVDLDGGVHCGFAGGATASYWALRANYSCSDRSWLYGSPVVGGGPTNCSGTTCILSAKKFVLSNFGMEPVTGFLQWIKIVKTSAILTNDPRCAALTGYQQMTCLGSLLSLTAPANLPASR
jgi:hypothetical protein